MYDRPTNGLVHDAFWILVRDNLRASGIDAPDALDRETRYSTGWGRPDLVLGQICNLPLRAQFLDKVTVIGAADYGIPDCPAGHYNSVFVVHRDAVGDTPRDFADTRFAANSLMSHSGYGAPQAWAKDNDSMFRAPILTGSHDRSVMMIADRRADIAAIDAQTWALQQRDMPMTKDLRVVGVTGHSPCMTFITRPHQDPAPYFAAITNAIADLGPDGQESLGLKQIVSLPAADYDLPMPSLPQTIDA
jgi:ABC-type phosphate/phosphonate transport system substrate-binding protein